MSTMTKSGKSGTHETGSQPANGLAAESVPCQEASPDQVRDWLRSGEAVLIDVREPDEHARERISGSKLISLSRFDPAQAAACAQPGQRVVMHCKGGRRGADAVRMSSAITGRGVVIVNMTGGIEAWKKASLPVEVNASVSRISVMRQVQLVIGLGVLGGSALAWFVHPAFIGIPAFFGAGLTFAGATGTCALASLLGMMPWNKAVAGAAGAGECGTSQCK